MMVGNRCGAARRIYVEKVQSGPKWPNAIHRKSEAHQRKSVRSAWCKRPSQDRSQGRKCRIGRMSTGAMAWWWWSRNAILGSALMFPRLRFPFFVLGLRDRSGFRRKNAFCGLFFNILFPFLSWLLITVLMVVLWHSKRHSQVHQSRVHVHCGVR